MKKSHVIPFIIRELFLRYGEHEIGQAGGQFAYFLTLSMFPLLIFINAVIGMLNIPETIIIEYLSPILPADVVGVLSEYLSYLSGTTSASPISVGILIILFTGSRSIYSLVYAMDKAYGAERRNGFIKNHAIPMIFTIGIGFSVIFTIILGSIGKDFILWLNNFLHFVLISAELWGILRWAVLVTILVLLLSSMYYFLPNVKQHFGSVLPGAAFALTGWIILVWGFSVYINGFLLKWGIYGSLGAIIVLMIWFYFIGVILIIGAELNSILQEYRDNIYHKVK